MARRRPWQDWELRLLAKEYPHCTTAKLAKKLKRSITSVYQRAQLSGLHKSELYLASPDACRLRRGDNVGATHRFLPGHAPANKGLRRPGWAPGRMAQTQFQPGNKPHTWKPIGTTRYSKEGYLQRKVSDTGYPPRDWVGEHILMWQKERGPVPKGFAVSFRDGDKSHLALDNFELISRCELMRRNTIHRFPPELSDAIRLNGALKRRMRKLHEEQAVGPSQPSV
jgi:hypothetical protein